jgi:hypothetical protein
MLHVQPVPLALLGVSPAGNESLAVTVVPLVEALPLLVTVSVKLPVVPRVNVAALALLVIVSEGAVGSAVETVTDPLADDESPPPATLAVFVNDAAALLAIETFTAIAG